MGLPCDVAIKLENVSKTFETQTGDFTALDDISFEIKKSSCTVLAGQNGSGKTLLMQIIAGLVTKTKGNVYTQTKVGLIFQEATTQILGETPFEDIAFGLEDLHLSKTQKQNRIQQALVAVGLEKKAHDTARLLSGGQKRKLAVACMLSLGFEILIFDEPYANLDYKSVKQVNDLIKQLLKQKKTVVILSHEIEKCLGLCSQFIVLNKGKILFNDSPQKALKQDFCKWNIHPPLCSYTKLEDLVW